MSNSDAIRAIINAHIKTNRNQEITGKILNSVLNQMVTDKDAGISKEAELRAAEDERIAGLINKEIEDRESADAAISEALLEEATARKNADTTINNALSAETSARQDEDAAIRNALSEEVTAREEGDTSLLNAINEALSKGYLFAGVATTDTNPGTPEGKVFYIANGKGIYTNFGGLEVTDDDDFAIFTYDDAWAKSNVAISSSGGGIAQTMTETTYAELKSMRDNGTLTPGMWYRITDYVCTTTQSNTISAGNKFDIIVLATGKNSLSEQARAINHTPQEGETDYFANSNLSAWQIWYCLDNDTTRFAWADDTNGKGVIYKLIDEWGNNVPYDFKNIKFRHPYGFSGTYYYYTFSSDKDENNTDISLDIVNGCYSNQISPYVDNAIQAINYILFIGNNCNNNSLNFGCQFIFFGNNCSDNYLGCYCKSIKIGNYGFNNTFGHFCRKIILGNENENNTLNIGCSDYSWGDKCSNNIIESLCAAINFGNNCEGNYFGQGSGLFFCGDNCCYNSFGAYCNNIKFASDSSLTTKYNYYQYNHFGDNCEFIVFKGVGADLYNQVQNYNFTQRTKGTFSEYLSINGEKSRGYETKVALNSSGALKIYCEADLVQ